METRESVSGRLVEAAEKGSVEEVESLLKHASAPVDPPYAVERDWTGGKTAFREAAANGHVEVVKALPEDGRVDPGADESAVLWWAADKGHTDVVELLLKDGRADPAAEDNSAVRRAAKNGHTEVVRLLLKDSRVDAAAEDNYAVWNAAYNGRVETVRLLLQHPRVDGTHAILNAKRGVVPVLIEDEKCGIWVNRSLFERYHPWAVEKYEQLCAERTDRKWAAVWCMKEIGMGWADIMCPFGERMHETDLSANWGDEEM